MNRTPPALPIEQIKRLVVTACLSDDVLFENLVLKGGNAIDLIHQITMRASVDIDFSMMEDFPGGADELRIRMEQALTRTFDLNGYMVFDFKMTEKPDHLSPDMAGFWGGYGFEFKLIASQLAQIHGSSQTELRKYALNLGQGTKFLIDVSRHEYIGHKQVVEFDGYLLYVYSPEMIVCEKLRAICQQMPEYGPIIKRNRPGAARARDFVDIYYLTTMLGLNVASVESRDLIKDIFKRKRVPLKLLSMMEKYRAFHKSDFDAVRATMSPRIKLEEFDTYFDFVLDLGRQLHTLWNE
ncbi:nucleotidyl transferase AbiEii/AbiGii toxin family protein [Achromobacter ruhlandii]|uniref:nucleotidyl transferase AbiEii/AbiGii toxin family protein n=1 Tax=Achromobacter ruhlandii TaxID=72557 RepID=UPI0009EDEA78|nr:nucleotidyl transferase AbiEii/AbiGii toxin family protein [Achromobacter ruhlandii]